MKCLIVLTALLAGASADADVSVADLLAKPLAERVDAFKSLKEKGHVLLARAAFDSHNGLQLRWRALTTMGKIDPQEYRTELNKALASGEWFMRNAALIALQNGEREQAVSWSTRLLEDPALVVRTQAVRNLIQLDARESEGQLWQQIFSRKNFHSGESLWVRAHMAEALAHFSSPGRTKQFQRLLIDPDIRLHKWAIQGLENITGLKMGDRNVPLEVRRQQWLERMGAEEI